jgi:hypothetical protein
VFRELLLTFLDSHTRFAAISSCMNYRKENSSWERRFRQATRMCRGPITHYATPQLPDSYWPAGLRIGSGLLLIWINRG